MIKHLLRNVVLAIGILVPQLALPATAETFVLVHGAFDTSASWKQVAQLLEKQGHTAIGDDLPGRNADGAAAKAITLQSHVAAVKSAIDATKEPVTLVGHSFGGMTISQTAEAIPDRIKQLIYVAAYIPLTGESMQTLAYSDTTNGFKKDSFVVATDYSHASILDRDKVAIFIEDGTPAQQTAFVASMVREPLGPIATPVEFTAARFGSVAKAYVKTNRDRSVSPELQARMIARAGLTKVLPIESGHMPQITKAEDMAAALIAIAQSTQ